MSLSLVPQDTATVRAPDAFGAYVVEERLGEGTMGCVYRARHQTLGRRVAVKSLHQALLGDPALVRRFLQEARLVNTINHPHIVEVHDFVEEPGQVYAVMELLEGETLTARLASQPLSLETLVRIATEVAEALAAAHALKVVHRDLKPDNVFLATRDGREWVKVLDFGVAKLLVQDGPRVVETQNGDVLGTPRYMAPEQAAGLECDTRTDVYAFGTVLFEMLAGRPPFEATVFGQLAADIITRPPPPVPTLTRTGEPVPEALRRLVVACLAKNADHRPQTMQDVLRQLSNLDVDLGLGPSVPRPRWYLPVALLTAVTIGAGVVFAVRSGGTRPAPVVEPSAPVVAQPPTPPPPAPAPAPVTLGIETTPAGATVTDEGTGEVLGTTPLALKREARAQTMKVRIELKGHEPVTREFSTAESLRVELPLKRLAIAAPKKETKAVTDGVIDPF
ncbi:MAG: serine/threonine protein kinase [Myxococcaceae bacterium]|nr:serine/threonine protein kinase [Myxococcaceae bacterium]